MMMIVSYVSSVTLNRMRVGIVIAVVIFVVMMIFMVVIVMVVVILVIRMGMRRVRVMSTLIRVTTATAGSPVWLRPRIWEMPAAANARSIVDKGIVMVANLR